MSIQADEMEHVVLVDCVCAAEQTGKLVWSDDMNCCSDITCLLRNIRMTGLLQWLYEGLGKDDAWSAGEGKARM